jgi:hypothetical protein
MKTALRFAAGMALVTATGTGCFTMTDTVRTYAAADLRCRPESIRTHELSHGVFRAEGCGRRAYYMDNDAPVTTARRENHRRDRPYWAMAAHSAKY